MGSQLKRTSELDEIEVALKRAAYQAVHGTREERSGRFLPEDRWCTARIRKSGMGVMAGKNHELYIERRSEGDYAIRRGGSERASLTAPTQKEAIEKAERLDPKAAILVERVRDTKIGGRDKWRKP
jgi:hypothetical protein